LQTQEEFALLVGTSLQTQIVISSLLWLEVIVLEPI
jgi:hypothetical protein